MRHLARLAACSLLGLVVVGIAGMPVASAEPATGSISSGSTSVLPVAVDLRKWAVTPGYQGAVNSCVPWTIDYAMLGWYSRYTGRVGRPFAPMYSYSQISTSGDYGTDPETVLQLAVTQGVAPSSVYTQGSYNWKTGPTAAERVAAANWKIKGWNTLFAQVGQSGNATLLRHALATFHPVAIRLEVRTGFAYLGNSPSTTDTDTTSAIQGSHEVLAVGYDAAGLIVQNSWGTGWANGGFGRISWAVVQKDVLEAQTIDGFVQAATAPSVSTPIVTKGVVVASGRTVKYDTAWKTTAGNTGAVSVTKVWYQVDGGTWVAVKLASARTTSWAFVARIGHSYRVAVQATAGSHIGTTRFSVAVRA